MPNQMFGKYMNFTFTAPSTDAYVVLKVGQQGGSKINIIFDSVSITGPDGDIIVNGHFGHATGWTQWRERGDTILPDTGCDGKGLRIKSFCLIGGYYQQITTEVGKEYTVSSLCRDAGSQGNVWAELLIGENEPIMNKEFSSANICGKWDAL